MGYQYRKRESALAGTRRIALEQIAGMRRDYRNGGMDPAANIHKFRRRCKQLRALLRLVRTGLGQPQHKEADRLFRDAARGLAGLRDARVRRESLEKLRRRFPASGNSGYLDRLLREFKEQEHRSLQEADAQIAWFADQFPAFKQNVLGWHFNPDEDRVLLEGFSKTYKQARHNMRAAYRTASPNVFHVWRKSVKYHYYQLCLLQRAWPAVLMPMSREAKALADLLGDEHDLTILEAALREDSARSGDHRNQREVLEMREVLKMIATWREEMRAAARPSGARLFQVRSAAVEVWTGNLWEGWQNQPSLP